MTTQDLTPIESFAARDIAARFLGQFSGLTAAFDDPITYHRLSDRFANVIASTPAPTCPFGRAAEASPKRVGSPSQLAPHPSPLAPKPRNFRLSKHPDLLNGFTFRGTANPLLEWLKDSIHIHYPSECTKSPKIAPTIRFEFCQDHMPALLSKASRKQGCQSNSPATHYAILFSAGYFPDMRHTKRQYTPVHSGIPTAVVSTSTSPLPLDMPSLHLDFPALPALDGFPQSPAYTLIIGIGIFFYRHDGKELLLLRQPSDAALFCAPSTR